MSQESDQETDPREDTDPRQDAGPLEESSARREPAPRRARDAREDRRLRALHGLGILDTPPEERFDRLTRLALRLFDAPIALVSLVDEDRQWFKSRKGLEAEEMPREVSFCSHAIQGDDVMVVSDAANDERFRQNPLVQGPPNIRFYASCPVRGPDGHKLGTICVIDHRPRELADDDAELLRDLAELVENEFRALQLATVDDLTGLTNRRGFHAIAYHTLALCQRMDKPAALLMFDLDDFKEINDTRGHAVGDEVLQRFADKLLVSFRDSDVVSRIGGDEFCVLLSGARAEEAPAALAHLDDSLRDDDGEVPLRYSVGVIQYAPDRHDNVAALLEEADERMYRDKEGKEEEPGQKNTGRTRRPDPRPALPTARRRVLQSLQPVDRRFGDRRGCLDAWKGLSGPGP